jgi:hypothetical protein
VLNLWDRNETRPAQVQERLRAPRQETPAQLQPREPDPGLGPHPVQRAAERGSNVKVIQTIISNWRKTMTNQPTIAAAAPVTQKEAETRFFTSTRHTLSKDQLRRLYKSENGKTILTAKWETRDGQPVLVGNGLTISFTRSRAGAVVGVVAQK